MEEDIETCGWFVFYKDQLLIEKKNGMYTIPFGTEPPMPVPVGSTIHTIGEIEGRTAKTFSVHAPVPGSENDRHLMMISGVHTTYCLGKSTMWVEKPSRY